MIAFVLMLFPAALAAQDRVETDDGFPIGIHLITIPVVLLFGVFLGWTLRERKLAQDEARRRLMQEQAAGTPPAPKA